jgi:hypothetical protein
MEVGILTLNRFNGQEQFSISKATIFQYEEDGVFELNLEIETNEKPIKTLPDTKELNAQPNAEFIVHLDVFSWENLVGKSFSIPQGYDEESEEYLTRIYYCEHQETDDNVIEIKEQQANQFRVVITATCVDVNYYDDSKPRTKIEIDAWFTAN